MSKQKVMATLLLSTLVLSLSSPLVTLAETINPETSLTMATASTESSSEAEKQETTHSPKVGYAVSFSPGQAGADGTYGHVAIVEEVKKDGSVLISESNAMGRGIVSYRTFSSAQAAQLTYVIGHK